MMQLATGVHGSPMQVAGIMLLGKDTRLTPQRVCDALAQRVGNVPRLRQRLMRTPFGAGRPVWVDDPDFDIRRHVDVVPCPAPGDEGALLSIAARRVVSPLPADRPLWSATVVSHLAEDTVGLVLVLHHALADGIGGLAVLGVLADGAPVVPATAMPLPGAMPRRAVLYADAFRSRWRAVGRIPDTLRRLRAAVTELRGDAVRTAPSTSLNRPIGPRRELAVVRKDLASIRDIAHAHDATVNDVVLTAVVGALHTLLCRRGETVDRIVVSIPVSSRKTTAPGRLGNQVGVIPVSLPVIADSLARLRAIAGITRRRKTSSPGSSIALMAPAFRLLARVGLFRWFISRQRLINTFVTNLRGPESSLAILDHPITDIVAVPVITGNVTIAFAVLSYAGTVTVTIIADPVRCPDLDFLTEELREELDALTRQVSSADHGGRL